MVFPRLIPILLTRNQRLVKTLNFSNEQYVGDITNAIRIFNEKKVDEIVVLDIGKRDSQDELDFNFLKRIAGECFMPLTYGGGIKGVDDAKKIVECGIEKVSINSLFHFNLSEVSKIIEILGSSSTVFSLDVVSRLDDYFVSNEPSKNLEKCMSIAEDLGFGEILIQDVNKDGTLSGPNIDLISKASSIAQIPLIYAGGISSVNDCVDSWRAGANAVGAGSWFVFKGPYRAVMISYPDYSSLNQAYRSI